MKQPQQNPKITPQPTSGTITISNGEVIQINSNSVKNNKSTQPSEEFIEGLKEAINNNLFKKEDGTKPTNPQTNR